jgi:hypothetical protein
LTPEQIDLAIEQFRMQLFPEEPAKPGTRDPLNLIPLDHIAHIVLSICVPFLTKVASETLYSVYKSARDSIKLKHAVQEVKENADSIQIAKLDDPALSSEVQKRLIENGFTEEQSKTLTPQLFDILRNVGGSSALGSSKSH